MVAVDSVIVDTIDIWPGECKTVNGKPRSPWVLGSVEKGNSNMRVIQTNGQLGYQKSNVSNQYFSQTY